MPFQRERSDGGASSHRAQDDSGSPTRSTLALDSQGDTLSPLRSHKDESQTRSSRSPLSTKFGPGSWIARVHSSWRHNQGDGNTSEVVRAVEEEDDPTVDWEKVLRELQVEKKRAAAKKNQKYINRSCYLFESNTPFRESVINLVEWHWFDRIVLFLILANCCFLVLDDPVCRCSSDWSSSGCSAHEEYKRILFSWDCSGWPRIQTLLDVSEIIFTVLFTFEMLIKIVARGFILHKHAFLRDGWNWIDFIVVVTSLISQIPSLQTNLQMLRTVRVLRPLRTMTRIKGMTPLVNTFLRSFKALGNVILLLFFFFCVFGILGIELLTGALRGRCYIDPTQEFASAAVRSALESQQFPYIAEPGNNVGGWNGNVGLCSAVGSGGAKCDPVAIDGVEYATVCSNKKWCHTDWCANDWNDNPFDFGGGTFSYDNFAASWLVIFQTLTVEGWVDILYSYEDGFQKWGSRVFHTAWVLIGTFFVVQLALAVLANSFVLALEEERIHKAREAMDEDSLLRPTRAMARRFTMFKSQERSTSLARGLESAGKSMQSSFFASFNWTSFMGGNHNSSTEGKKKQPSALALWGEHNLWGPGTTGNRCYHTVRRSCRILVRSEYFSNTIIVAIVINTLCLALDYHDQARYESDICRRRCELDPDIPAGLSDRCIGPLFNRTFDSDGLGGGRRPLQAYDNFCFMDDDRATGIRGGALECGGIESAEECWAAGGRNACWWFGGSNVPCKRGLYSAKSFSETPNGALNLRHICGDLLDQCQNFAPERQLVFERINTILTFVFISEMVVKMVGLGFLEYFDDQFNQFDFFVVMASIFELIVNTLDSSSSSGSTISALRGMRLFRLFKLARSWKSMRKILKTLGIAIRSLGPLTIIWVMFMYIFALLGMQYFGGNFRQIKTEAPRSNFDSFFPSQLGHGAFLVTFQIITSENWNTIAYNSIGAAGSPLGALPSILIVLFGNYIIMNLFISILLQGFADDGFDQDGNESSFVEGGPRSLKGLKLSAADLYRRMLGRASRQISIDDSALMRQHSQQVFRRASDGLKALSETGSRRSSAMSYSGPGTGGAKITGLDAEERREVLERTTVALKERAEETSPQRQRQEGQAEVMQGGSQLSVASVRERDRAGSTPPAKLKPAEAGVRRALPSSEEDDAKAQQEVTASGQGFGTEEDEGAGAGGGAAEDAMSESVSGATVAVSATPSLRVDTPVRAFGDGVSGDEGQGASEASEEKDAKKGDKSPHSAVSAPHIRRLSKPGVDEFPPSSPTAAAAGPTVPLPSPKPSGTTKSVRMADLASTSQRQILDFESQGLPGAVQDPRSERPVRQVSDLVSATPNSPLANAVRCDLPKPAGNDRTVRFPAEEQPAGAKKVWKN